MTSERTFALFTIDRDGARQFAVLGATEARATVGRATARIVAVDVERQVVVWATRPDLDGGLRPEPAEVSR